MADSAKAKEVYWYDPEMRGVLPIDLHVPKRLRKTVRRAPYKITFNRDFRAVINKCANVRPETWINDEIKNVFIALHHAGFAHSVEAWQEDECVGGTYGLAIGGAFFGESMFSTATDASKICLVHLAAHLKRQEFDLFDTQFINDHLKQFGVYEMPRETYLAQLTKAILKPVRFIPNLNQSSFDSSDASDASDASVDGAAVSALASSSSAAVSFALDAGEVELFLQSITQTS